MMMREESESRESRLKNFLLVYSGDNYPSLKLTKMLGMDSATDGLSISGHVAEITFGRE